MSASSKQPEKRPEEISEYARVCLESLGERGYGRKISLCGAFALAYFVPYRVTHDLDAWWEDTTTGSEQQGIIECLKQALQPFGEVTVRRWGDVVSIELIPPGEKHAKFAFQIARRAVRLEPPLTAPWPDNVYLDALPDLIASKMVALVERGAPRDFYDMHAICQQQLATPEDCWDLWRRRQELAGADTRSGRARIAVLTHLSRIVRHRPLEEIEDPDARKAADTLRKWFEKEFLDALGD